MQSHQVKFATPLSATAAGSPSRHVLSFCLLHECGTRTGARSSTTVPPRPPRHPGSVGSTRSDYPIVPHSRQVDRKRRQRFDAIRGHPDHLFQFDTVNAAVSADVALDRQHQAALLVLTTVMIRRRWRQRTPARSGHNGAGRDRAPPGPCSAPSSATTRSATPSHQWRDQPRLVSQDRGGPRR